MIIQVDFGKSKETAALFHEWIKSGAYLAPFAEWCAEQDAKVKQDQA